MLSNDHGVCSSQVQDQAYGWRCWNYEGWGQEDGRAMEKLLWNADLFWHEGICHSD